MRTWANRLDLTDIWRRQHKDERQYTRQGKKSDKRKEVAKRIDYILINEKFASMVTSTNIRQINSQAWNSDHAIIEMTIAGPLALRDFSREMYQKPTYDMTGPSTTEPSIGRLGKRSQTDGKVRNNKDE